MYEYKKFMSYQYFCLACYLPTEAAIVYFVHEGGHGTSAKIMYVKLIILNNSLDEGMLLEWIKLFDVYLTNYLLGSGMATIGGYVNKKE